MKILIRYNKKNQQLTLTALNVPDLYFGKRYENIYIGIDNTVEHLGNAGFVIRRGAFKCIVKRTMPNKTQAIRYGKEMANAIKEAKPELQQLTTLAS